MSCLEIIKEQRGMDFLKIGMRVEFLHDGRFGNIVGGNARCNLNIKFDGENSFSNCHPTWQMRYFDKDNNVIAEYKD